MKERYATIVLGATYYGLGYTSSHPDCLILEESQTVGGDFHHCLHPVRMDDMEEETRGTELAKIMQEYGVWTDSGFDMLKAQTVAHEFAARKLTEGMEIILDARILSVERRGSGVAVSFITNEGIQEIAAENIVDATVDCISAPEAVCCTAKTLNVFTVAMTESFNEQLRKACPVCCILEGPLENEKLVQFSVPADTPITEAYLQMMNYWGKAFPNGEEKILFVAQTFDARYEPVREKPAAWVGERFANPVAAFAKGAMAR